jgi:hypothetical protein
MDVDGTADQRMLDVVRLSARIFMIAGWASVRAMLLGEASVARHSESAGRDARVGRLRPLRSSKLLRRQSNVCSIYSQGSGGCRLTCRCA